MSAASTSLGTINTRYSPGADEMSGIQALERTHPLLPMKPRLAERVEFEYIRHGTQSQSHWHIAKGKVITPSIGGTRTEFDLLTILLKLLTPTRKLAGFSLLTN